jgi:hypothetical protein
MRIPWRLVTLKRALLHRWEGEGVLRDTFRKYQGREFDLGNARTFTEKLFRRMILVHRYRDATFTRLADKYLVREHVAAKVGERHLVRLLWQGTDPRRIPFDDLPPKCVIKTNHGSGGNIVFERGGDRAEAIRKLRKWLREDHYLANREYHYHDIKRRVIVEEFLDDGFANGPLDYRFWCFHGEPAMVQVDDHRHGINPFYDLEWQLLPVRYRRDAAPAEFPRPANFDLMRSVVRTLAADFDFVRVDLYNVHGQVYVGELTFTPVAGQFTWDPPEWDMLLGEKWHMEPR